jgi:hypothetical protein
VLALAFVPACARAPLSTQTDPGADGGVKAACEPPTNLVQPIPPDVLLVVDKSASMNDEADGTSCSGSCGATSKWSQVTNAVDSVVTQTQASVNWGLKLFASAADGCDVSAGVEVPVGPSSAAAITARIAATNPDSRTPTRLAESAGAAYLATLTDKRPKYLLLATDGLPNCDPAALTPTDDDSKGAEQAVADARAAGFPTFVIGIGQTMAEATLTRLALQGGVPQPGGATAYYQVSDTAGLVAALGAILGSVTCVFDLPTPKDSRESTQNIAVFVNGALLSQDSGHTSGWDYHGADFKQIQIYGPTCDGLMGGKIASVAIQFLCP